MQVSYPLDCSQVLQKLFKQTLFTGRKYIATDLISLFLCKFKFVDAAWDSAFLDNIDHRLQSLEKNLTQCADRFICEPSPTAQESAAGGLTIVSGRSELHAWHDVEQSLFSHRSHYWLDQHLCLSRI